MWLISGGLCSGEPDGGYSFPYIFPGAGHGPALRWERTVSANPESTAGKWRRRSNDGWETRDRAVEDLMPMQRAMWGMAIPPGEC